MRKLIGLLLALGLCAFPVEARASAFTWDSGYKGDVPDAEDIATSTTNFGGILSSSDTYVQTALDTIDDFSTTPSFATSVTVTGSAPRYIFTPDAGDAFEIVATGSTAYLVDTTDGVIGWLLDDALHLGEIGFEPTHVEVHVSQTGDTSVRLGTNTIGIDELDAIDTPADTEVYTYDATTGRGEWSSAAAGDISAIGDVTSGAAFDGTQGTTLTFNNAGGDATLDYDGTDIESSTILKATSLLEGANAVPNATDHLGFFAATTSAQLAGVLSDETGSGGGFVRATLPTIAGIACTGDIDIDAANANITIQHTGGDEFHFGTEAGSIVYISDATDGVTYWLANILHGIEYGDPSVTSHVFRASATGDAVVQLPGNSIGGGEMVDATTAAAGDVEPATILETTTGTDTARAVTPDSLAGSDYGIQTVSILVFDDSTAAAVADGAGDVFWRVPSTLNGYNLVTVAAHVQTAGQSGETNVQIHNVTQSADMLSTIITIEGNEKDSATAGTPAVIDTANDDVATADEIRIDVDAPLGVLVELQFQAP